MSRRHALCYVPANDAMQPHHAKCLTNEERREMRRAEREETGDSPFYAIMRDDPDSDEFRGVACCVCGGRIS